MRRRARLLTLRLLALAGLMVSGLPSGGAGAQDAGRIVRVKGGETMRIAAPGGLEFSLRFTAVVSDERCPARVTCAWANPPVLNFEVSAPGQPTQVFELSADIRRGTRRAHVRGTSIRYVDLLPVPQDSTEFAKLKPLRIYTAVVKIGEPEKP